MFCAEFRDRRNASGSLPNRPNTTGERMAIWDASPYLSGDWRKRAAVLMFPFAKSIFTFFNVDPDNALC
jgi:hypothetical protein